MNKTTVTRALLLAIVLFSPLTKAQTTVSSPMELYQHLSDCNSLKDAVVYTQNSFRIALAADPNGYCTVTVNQPYAKDPITCYLSAADIQKMTSPEAQKIFASAQTTKTENINAADVLNYFSPLAQCLNAFIPIQSLLTAPLPAQ